MKLSESNSCRIFAHPFTVIAMALMLFSPYNLNSVDPGTFIPASEGEKYALDLLLPQAEISSGEDFITIPLKTAGRLFMVDAVIDGQTGNLIFDTGASGIVLNTTYFRKYVQMNNQNSNGITGKVDKVTTISINSLKISETELKKFSASLADLGHIENSKGVKVLGLFGFEIFKNFEIVLDINHQVMQLYKIDKQGGRINKSIAPFIADYTQKIESSKNILFLEGIIAGKELRFCLDTGAETNAISSHANKSVLKTVVITSKSNLQGVGSSKSEVLLGSMSDFRFGDRELSPMKTIVTNLDALSEAYEVQIDGMLGYDFLKKGKICINFVKKQIGIIYTKT
jgi:predicted aspartyl protease